ncbi:molybdate ABC transporter substrate-binding protein [Verticiella sediminum]|uniref:Molybdate ABC transporter substrate-binding protein n=1 Tax=Verticiella sediminum TaxID=1247510 RepID=A0A556ABY6_9BURK|nr:molybdate ABC transporter substrate-binding protein [Verticiella sediminum]TSH90399.1 molybdate ABC transporter substrate-binding protein [Verticiella sediminum]
MRLSRLLAATTLAVALPFATHAATLTVSAAASLTNAFKELAPSFSAEHPGTDVQLNFAASGTLLQQIDQGAPADVFASADQATMDRAAEKSLIDPATRRDFVSNALVLIEPSDGGPGVDSLNGLTGDAVKRIAVGKPASVPAGRYTQEVLEKAGLWQTLEPKYVQADSVRQVLDYVARGEVDAGFVYRTDAAIMSDKVKVTLTPEGQTPVTYPVAVVAASREPDLAKAFVEFLGTPAARTVLEKYGFGQP